VERHAHPAAWETRVAERLRSVPPVAGFALAAGLVVAIGGLDTAITVLAGEDVVITILYLVPVGLAVASAGSRVGLAVAIMAAGVETWSSWTADPVKREHSIHLFISEVLQFFVFAGAAGLVGALRGHLGLVRELARTDPVSGLPNRRALAEMAELERLRAQRSRAPLSFAYVDLDGFKAVNDISGVREYYSARHTSQQRPANHLYRQSGLGRELYLVRDPRCRTASPVHVGGR
jgi:Diguanylate cyclase, GGDEF domain